MSNGVPYLSKPDVVFGYCSFFNTKIIYFEYRRVNRDKSQNEYVCNNNEIYYKIISDLDDFIALDYNTISFKPHERFSPLNVNSIRERPRKTKNEL